MNLHTQRQQHVDYESEWIKIFLVYTDVISETIIAPQV